MTKSHQPDYILLALVLVLVIFGLIMVASASVVKGFQDIGDGYYYAKHQLFYGALPGLLLFFILGKFYYRRWEKFALPLLVLSFGVLLAVFIPALSVSAGGATRWVSTSFFSFQPAEFAKIGFIVYLAVWFNKKGNKMTDFNETFVPFLVLLGLIGFLIIKQPNLGMLSIIVSSSLALYFVAGGKISHFIFLIVGIIAVFIVFVKTSAYRMKRFDVYLYPELDPLGKGYQINQALLAIGSGGLFGLGFGRSGQKYNYLPEPFGDSIFAIMAEEIGFIGIMIFFAFFLFFLIRCINIAKNAPDNLSKLLVSGLTVIIAAQFFMNIGAITRLIPLTGVPLPFISYGGSALISTLAGVGIIFNISRYTIKNSRY